MRERVWGSCCRQSDAFEIDRESLVTVTNFHNFYALWGHVRITNNFHRQHNTQRSTFNVAVIFQHLEAALLPNPCSRRSSWSNFANHRTLEQSEHAWPGFRTLHKHLTLSDTSSFRDVLSWKQSNVWNILHVRPESQVYKKEYFPLIIQQLPHHHLWLSGNGFLWLRLWGRLCPFFPEQIIAWALRKVHQACDIRWGFYWVRTVEGMSVKAIPRESWLIFLSLLELQAVRILRNCLEKPWFSNMWTMH